MKEGYNMFDALMESYKNLSIDEKREVNNLELKKMIAIVENLCEKNNILYREIKSNEIATLNSDNLSETDYLEAQYVYITYLKEVVAALIEAKF